VGARSADLRTTAAAALGEEPAYTVADISTGMAKNGLHVDLYLHNAFDKRAVLDRYAECDILRCGEITKYDVPNQPRTVGLKFGQKF
jgi:hypothetical protein